MSTLHATAGATHVEACCSTGSSPGAVRSETLAATLDLERAGPATVELRYESVGTPGATPVAVLGGISAGRHLTANALDPSAGWWPGVAGPGQALDPLSHRLVGLDWLGGAYGTWSSPAPPTPTDQARALAAVLDHLEIPRVTVVGASYGGMVALAFGALFPHRVTRCVVLCAAHRPHPMATAVRSVQRGIVRLTAGSPRAEEGVALARALAMTTYRTTEEFEGRFPWSEEGARVGRPRFPVESYLEHHGHTFAQRFSGDALARLSASIDLCRVEPERVTAPTTVVSVDSDLLAPPWLVDELARLAPGVDEHVRLSSTFGHDGFLKETRAVSELLRGRVGGEVVS